MEIPFFSWLGCGKFPPFPVIVANGGLFQDLWSIKHEKLMVKTITGKRDSPRETMKILWKCHGNTVEIWKCHVI